MRRRIQQPRHSLPARAPPACALASPHAYEWLTAARSLTSRLVLGLIVSAMLCMIIPPVGFFALALCGYMLVGTLLFRVFLTATFFIRYSLAHLMSVYLSAS